MITKLHSLMGEKFHFTEQWQLINVKEMKCGRDERGGGGVVFSKSNEIIDLGKDYQMALKPLDVWLMGTHRSYRFTVQTNEENPHMMEGLESTPNPAVNLIIAKGGSHR